MRAYSTEEAWNKAYELMKSGYSYDKNASQRAGYPIYMSDDSNSNAHVSDLGDRLEVNLDDGKSINIWIKGLDQYTKEVLDRVLDDFIYEIEDKVDHEFRARTGIDEMIDKAYEIGKKWLGWGK